MFMTLLAAFDVLLARYCGADDIVVGAPYYYWGVGQDGAAPENRVPEQGGSTGSFDHIAFSGRDVGAMIARLKACAIPYRENLIADINLHQLFVCDPNGILVEMNFRG